MARTEDSRPGLPDRDWEGECLDLTRRLIQQDTANPPGNEYRAGEVLAEFLDSAGIDVEVIDPAMGELRLSRVSRVTILGAATTQGCCSHTSTCRPCKKGSGVLRRLRGRSAGITSGAVARSISRAWLPPMLWRWSL